MELSSLPSNLKRTNIYKPPALGSHLINFRGYRLFGKNPKQQKLSLLAKVCTRSFKVKVKKLCLIHYWFSFDTNVFFVLNDLLTYNSCQAEEIFWFKLFILMSCWPTIPAGQRKLTVNLWFCCPFLMPLGRQPNLPFSWEEIHRLKLKKLLHWVYVSNERKPGWFGWVHMGLYSDYTTQLYRDFNKPI